MLVRIGVQFSVKEAREIVNEINSMPLGENIMDARFPGLKRLANKLSAPLAEEIKVEAQPPQEDTHA